MELGPLVTDVYREIQRLILKINSHTDKPCAEKCRFLCRWMTTKHAYLFEELYVLQNYLGDCDNHSMEFRAKEGAEPLSRETFQYVSKSIEKQSEF